MHHNKKYEDSQHEINLLSYSDKIFNKENVCVGLDLMGIDWMGSISMADERKPVKC